ncbi:DeoR/GlpR family DNA-binding transcription regulator [Cernens ardua]|uniref:DeoR/GlpR family DNA-binding transcription regulator n=1 Tax=Cernens ardua TaxID=3402176 RepID=UPI003F9C91E7
MVRKSSERREQIMALLEDRQQMSVEALSDYFDTSEVTIRKDLTRLEEKGLLIRRYGGASLLPHESTSQKGPTAIKQRIAEAARKRIRDHARIVVDCGSTTSAMIPELKDILGLVVMTNSLEIATQLCELPNHPSLLMTGGTWDERSMSFQGNNAEQMLRSYDFDQFFVGADGIDIERGSTSFKELLRLSQVMAEVSREVIVMAEADKIGRRMPNLELSWGNIDVLITDDRILPQDLQNIKDHGVEVVVIEYVEPKG